MASSQKLPSFSCELRIIQAQNIEFIKPMKNLFARFYLPAGNNKRIQLNTKKVPSNSVPFWNESFNLECSCPQEFLQTLKQESLVLELRQSNTGPAVLKRILGSHLVGRGEIPWKTILEAPNMEFKEWVKVSGSDDCDDDATLRVPEVQVEIKIQVALDAEIKKENRRRRLNNWDECGCKHGHDQHAWCSTEDYDIFALGAILEAF
ncbi:C2 domain [Sesbania bispinosa]|nr:C2 domain [Sesbania bispinosa]